MIKAMPALLYYNDPKVLRHLCNPIKSRREGVKIPALLPSMLVGWAMLAQRSGGQKCCWSLVDDYRPARWRGFNFSKMGTGSRSSGL